MILTFDGKEKELFVGDTIITKEGNRLLLVSAEGFNLSDYGVKAEFIVINAKFGSMESYFSYFHEITESYDIADIIPNEKSFSRGNS
jgi:hypothetical protein